MRRGQHSTFGRSNDDDAVAGGAEQISSAAADYKYHGHFHRLRRYFTRNTTVPFHVCILACIISFSLGRVSMPIKVGDEGSLVNTVDIGEDFTLRNINEFHQSFKSTDKTFRHGYQWFYGRHLSGYRAKKDLAILEIGSRRGNSALSWSKYFGSHASIDMITYGGHNDTQEFKNPTIDCKRGGGKKCGRIHTFYCDQSDSEKLEKEVIAVRPDGWDIVIDDGSHVPAHNVISFEAIWKNVRPGGIYVVEDIETSYYPQSVVYGYEYNAGILAHPPLNALSRFRQYVDVINRGYLGPNGGTYSLFEGDHNIMEIGYARNLIFVRKALEGRDDGKKSYGDYPHGIVKGKGFKMISNTVEEALALFKQQSEMLNKWRPVLTSR